MRHVYPFTVERIYARELRNIMQEFARGLLTQIRPVLAAEVRAMRNDSPADLMRIIRQYTNKALNGDLLAQRIARAVEEANGENIASAVEKVIGVRLTPEGSALRSALELWAEDNAQRITNMQTDYLARVQNAVTRGLSNGWTNREIAAEINKATGIGLKRAKLIARDQVGTLNAQITKNRDEELGITKFKWRTMRDIAVRGAPMNGIGGKYPDAVPSHVAREGEEYEYSNPPDGELPGQPIQCRCYAEAVIEF